jgi:hypothetical protein
MENIEIDKNEKITAEFLCKVYKFYRQQTNPYIEFPISFNKLKISTFYKTNKKVFNKLYFISNKYHINMQNYIYFCIFDLHISNPKDLLNINFFRLYANKLKVEKQYKKIYLNFLKTANYIADICLSNNITPKEYIKKIIQEKRIGFEYMSGKLSTHFLASIKGIKNIFKFLDNNTKLEMSIIYDATEKLNGDIQEAFMKYKSHRVSPLKFTEQMIKLKKIKQNKQ